MCMWKSSNKISATFAVVFSLFARDQHSPRKIRGKRSAKASRGKLGQNKIHTQDKNRSNYVSLTSPFADVSSIYCHT